jgi:branched-chain amino acid transport system permease protein
VLTLGISQLLQRTATSLPDVTGGANGKLAPALDLVGGYYLVLAACVQFTVARYVAGDVLARQRLEHITALIRQRWRDQGEPYRLVVNTDLVER